MKISIGEWFSHSISQHGFENLKNGAQMQNGELVVLARCSSVTEAIFLRDELLHNGIQAHVANDKPVTGVGSAWFGKPRVDVLVFVADVERALEVKDQLLSSDTEETIPEWICSCGETVDAGFEICWSCASPHPDSAETDDSSSNC